MRLCLVPPGPFVLGTDKAKDEMGAQWEDEHYGKEHAIDYAYAIGQFPISNAQYHEFVQAGGYAHAPYWPEASAAEVWRDGQVFGYVYNNEKGEWEQVTEGLTAPRDYGEPFNLPNHPVVGVCWYEALAFVRWMNDCHADMLPSGWQFRLPSEVEWEKAARGGLRVPVRPVVLGLGDVGIRGWGDDGMRRAIAMKVHPNPAQRYPYGHDVDTDAMNVSATELNQTNALGGFPKGCSLYGAQEMSGGVWEWTRSLWRNDQEDEYRYPYDRVVERERLEAGLKIQRVVRGGAWNFGNGNARVSSRLRSEPNNLGGYLGFRLEAAPV